MKYTSSKKADKEIEKQLKIVTDIIVKEMNPISIILFGSLGKGEGSIYKNKLFNDIDLYVITKNKVSETKLEQVGFKASRAINKGGMEFIENTNQIYDADKFFHVDLRAIQYSQLSRLRKTTRIFELKHSTKLLYGKDIRSLIKINKKQLPLSEGIRHLFNKSCFLLMTIDNRRLKGKFLKDEKKYLIYHSIKTILGCTEALLLSKKDDAPTYTGRNKLFKKYYKNYPQLTKQVDLATKFKLNLQFDKIKDPVKLWKQARDFLDFTTKYIAKNNLNIKFKNRKDLIKKLNKKLPLMYFNPYIPLGKITFPAQYLLNLLYFKKTKYIKSLLSWKDIGIRIFFPAYLLLYSIEHPELKEEARKYLKNIAPIKGNSWQDLRKSLLYAYGAYYSQKLI